MNVESIAVRAIFPALMIGCAALLPVAMARQNKCTSGETAFMIAKRFTSERAFLREEQNPDFPWLEPGMVSYEGGCGHEIHSWFDRDRNGGRERNDYTARVRYDVFLNDWSLEDWKITATHPLGRAS